MEGIGDDSASATKKDTEQQVAVDREVAKHVVIQEAVDNLAEDYQERAASCEMVDKASVPKEHHQPRNASAKKGGPGHEETKKPQDSDGEKDVGEFSLLGERRKRLNSQLAGDNERSQNKRAKFQSDGASDRNISQSGFTAKGAVSTKSATAGNNSGAAGGSLTNELFAP